MIYKDTYLSPIGKITLVADEIGLTKASFSSHEENPYLDDSSSIKPKNLSIEQAKNWLDEYFSNKIPKQQVALHLVGTCFQYEVWQLLLKIPYGQTTTYGSLAKQIAFSRGIKRMSSQAVGQAIGKNPIGIIVPCHRVIGVDKSLVGYAGGLDIKEFLLKLEGSI